MAVTGLRPIVEIMFSDFLPTAGDVVVNELPKFRFMSGGQCEVPVTIRSIGGATGRFGTQHSATGESWYMGLPGLKVATAGTPASAYGVLRAAIREQRPGSLLRTPGPHGRKGPVARGDTAITEGAAAAVLRRGPTSPSWRRCSRSTGRSPRRSDWRRTESRPRWSSCSWLRPFDVDSIAESVERTGRLLVVEEQVHAAGWGASLISELTLRGHAWRERPRVISLPDNLLIPYTPELEDTVIPTVERIVDEVRSAIG